MSKAHHFDTSFVDLAPEDFPFIVRFYNKRTDELLQELVVEGPGAIFIPPKAEGIPLRITVDWPSGEHDVVGDD